MKRTVLLLLAIATAALAAGAAAARHAEKRSGALHLTKECSAYQGGIGQFCTITSSNVDAIEPGMRVVYLNAMANDVLDSDIALSSGNGGAAVGHVLLEGTSGEVTFSAGTGRFRGFHARARVSLDAQGLWHWDGTYRFDRPEDD